jgi:hypothetical protein
MVGLTETLQMTADGLQLTAYGRDRMDFEAGSQRRPE